VPAFAGHAAPHISRVLMAAGITLLPVAGSAQQLGPPIPLIQQTPPARSLDLPIREGAVIGEPLPPLPLGWSAVTVPPRDTVPGELWRGTPRAIADLLLARVPDTLSPALQSLERRILLSSTAAPDGPDEGDRILPTLRAAALLRLGELDAASAVIGAIPEKDRGQALPIAVAVDAIKGDIGRACATVRETIRHDQAAFWQTALIACQGLQGETDQASFGLQLLGEDQAARDDALAIAIEALAGRPAPLPTDLAEGLTPLTLRLLVAARQDIPPALIEALRPELALCLALDEEAPPATRLASAERAALFGALAPDRLGALYSALASAEQPKDVPALDHARRFAAIAESEATADRLARIVSFAEPLARQAAGFVLAARLVAPALHQIEPDPSLAAWATEVSRLLIAAGDSQEAQLWSGLVSEVEGRSLRALLTLATGRQAPPDLPEAQPTLLFAALSGALGQPVPSADWARLPAAVWTGVGPSPSASAAWLILAEAARAKRVGATILSALLVAAPAGALSSDPVTLYTAVSGLRQIELEADARRLAVEAALAARL
jgi:hypothetical protein